MQSPIGQEYGRNVSVPVVPFVEKATNTREPLSGLGSARMNAGGNNLSHEARNESTLSSVVVTVPGGKYIENESPYLCQDIIRFDFCFNEII